MGHIDSGKTSLAKALSTTASTSCYDKCPQSRERGITIDLGFSSVCVQIPKHLMNEIKDNNNSNELNEWTLQMTFVDSPGHSSLIKTIIGCSQIVDIIILVIDITKGIQTQTAECLVIAEITCNKMIVVLNKIDLIPPQKRDITIEKMSKRIQKTLEKTKFTNTPIVAISANPGGSDVQTIDKSDVNPIGLKLLMDIICDQISLPQRSPNGELLLSVDHCFAIRGSGTVMTGTIIQGSISVNDNIEIPSLKVIKKVKSIQMFKKQIEKAIQGDRVGVCVTQFDPKLMERGIVCSPGFMGSVYAIVANINAISYYRGKYSTKAKFHISILHETVIAKTTFFCGDLNTNFDFNLHYSYSEEMTNEDMTRNKYYVLLQFERPVVLNCGALYIASKLDTDIHSNVCRLAFYGNILSIFSDKNYVQNDLPNLKIFKIKNKEGIVERIANEYEIIGKNLFKKETNIQNFVGLKVSLSTGEEGFIDGCFGQSGKVKIRIPSGIKDHNLMTKTKRVNSDNTFNTQIKISLQFKRFIYDSHKKMIQI